MNKVSFVKVDHVDDGVQSAVRKAMYLADADKFIKGRSIFVKINAMSSEMLPGRNTSTWVLDGVLSEIRKMVPDAEIFVGDADLAGWKQFNDAVKRWGYGKVCKKYDAMVVNLSEQDVVEVDIGGKVLKKVDLPKILLDVNQIVNVPVAKTHVITFITCALKNHWGLLPRHRHRYHPVAPQVIADINRYFKKTTFSVVDATVCIEGNGPKTGKPKICDAVFAGSDRVAVDSAVVKFMGFGNVKHIGIAEEDGVGSKEYVLVGDEFEVIGFEKPNMKGDIVTLIETNLRKVPVMRGLIFNTGVFDLLGYLGTSYNYHVWFRFKGRKYVEEIMNTWYGEQFKEVTKCYENQFR